MAATRIAAELRPKMESFKANMWSALGSLKAWLTFALYDLIEALVKGRRTIAWIVENPGEALTLAKLTILGALEKLRGETLEIWQSVKTRIKNAVEEAESKPRDEDCYRSMEDAVKGLNAVAELNGRMTEVAEHTDQWKTYELFCRLDEARLSIEERKRILNGLDTIAGKSREAGSNVVEWLRLAIESGKLRDIMNSGLLSKIEGLDVNGLKSLQVALEEPNRLIELVTQPELISKAMGTLSEVEYYAFESRNVGGEGHVWLNTKIGAGTYRVRAELESDGGTTVVMWTIDTDGTNEVMVPKEYREDLAGKKVKLEICGYVPELHFPKYFSLPSLEGDVFLDFVESGLKIGGFRVEESRFGKTVKDSHHGLGLTVETNVKSVERGRLLWLRFYEDGTVRCLEVSGTPPSADPVEIREALLEVKQLGDEQVASLRLTLKWSGENWESIYPIKTLELKVGEKYPIDFSIEGDRTTGLQSEVRKVFGFDAVARIQKEMEAKEVMARITFEDGTSSVTKDPELVVRTGGAKKVIGIEFYYSGWNPKCTFEEAVKYFKEMLKISDENLVNKLARNYFEVLDASAKDTISAEEVEKTGDVNLLGKFGELQIIKQYAGKLRDIHYKVYVDSGEKYLDIVLGDAIVESKYWTSKDSYTKHFDELVEQLRGYKKAADQEGLKKVYLVFGKKEVFAEFDAYVKNLRDALGGDTNWLVICNGFDEFIKAYEGS
ncbi:MAG: hypothetical protein QXI87_09195 [Thermoproteota archaeon]